ncbi:nitroreductase family deazaflavin-dependent oxidoreductase [Nocardiopsis gilva YIM 90087]|uniref:Nitroreductase family deazaflavin-dependent oxidoreductase n=1 Tax=Nocardiopsis gilva YIM 90087 TaxID=1235441 RepID=A0A223SCV5_9ACTN|nr:nitroreductase family deazaflavin-dependent oxidoreductase [Nocardiopsis gilva]ASU85849.1 nitroreductase family deazaflavin-dependent oxidoreductase [Nocardiopsis gilva YIM 90087]
MKVIERPAPPTGVLRWLARLPIHLFRARLGWMFGTRVMLLTHTGRVSGRERRVVIEIVNHDDLRSGHIICCSGFGEKADWYKNVLRTPEVTVQVGTRAMRATATPLSADEGAEAMARYAERHPRAARKLARVMGFEVDGSESDFRAVGRERPFVRFTARA